MIHIFNFTNIDDELERFGGAEDMSRFALAHGCSGIELQMYQDPRETWMDKNLVKGIHLSFWNNWMDLWLGNESGLLEEFGDMKTVEEYYGGTSREAMVQKLDRELNIAQELGAKYVVFHVSEITIPQSYHRRFAYIDEEVIDASCELINMLMEGRKASFEFLMENLWWPGLNYQRPEMVKRLLDGVRYERKGLMLDTGHLMNCNTALRTQEQAVQYIYQILKMQEEFLPCIRGVHLNASLSGEYVEGVLGKEPVLAEKYWDRWCQVFSHIFQMDQHQAFSDSGVHELIQYIAPEYLTHELISRDPDELGRMIDCQQNVI
ncbi:TIM barrel protein [Ruminococcus sp. OA3]|uniref:TIM barrel protein n=1 Tax=Ruminococcus sp. OA3 TaxID=2914164 RepID=UPI001F057E26|nr:TIM barrel protein [Ruminococcus sp. OA3]MCH1982750.1 TIM barrel protein [Ruminococcus sp. OA3]